MDTLWHDDGHVLHLRLERSTLIVDDVSCPYRGDSMKPCYHETAGCIVDYFMGLYGLDCHVGVCVPTSALRVAWTLVGEARDLDAAQVWVISTQDEAFAAWLVTQRGSSEPASPSLDAEHVGVVPGWQGSEEVQGGEDPESDEGPASDGVTGSSSESGGEGFVVSDGDEIPDEDEEGEETPAGS